MFLIYSFIYVTVLVFLLPFEYLKRPRNLRKRWLREKFGAQKVSNSNDKRPVWIHAVSVGEVIAATSFIKALKQRHPHLKITVSTITDTGQKVAQERLSGLADIIYLPFDIPCIIKRVLRGVKPSAFITVETELWPNMLRTMKVGGIPVIVLNGRISESSFKGYKKIRFFMRSIIKDVDLFCMQDEEYGRRIVELGAKKEKVINTGSFKFDIKVSLEKPRWTEDISGPVIVAGSTHRGEEELIISVFKRLREDFRDLTLIIAPRHPERFDEVEDIMRTAEIPYVRSSHIIKRANGATAVLLDSIGELSSVYGISDIAVIGGSFIEHGGQNPLEPACWGKPVVCGPHMRNFPFIEEFYSAGAALKADSSNLYDILRELLSAPDKRQATGKAAKALLDKNRGAVDRAIRVIQPFLNPDLKPSSKSGRKGGF